MKIEPGDLIMPLIVLIGMLIPAGTILWKFSKIILQVDKNKDDINRIGTKFNDYITNQEKRLTEIASQYMRVSELLARMDERMSNMAGTMQEIKLEMQKKQLEGIRA